MRSGGGGKKDEDKDEERWRSYSSVFTNAKAGMDGVDADRIKKIVYEASRHSPHYKNELRKEEQAEKRLLEFQAKARALLPQQLEALDAKAARRAAELDASRDLSRTWMHVDMDMFYAAVHILDEPRLATVPMAVGGKSMISTANYAARKFGVRSAMPGFIALKLCPQLTFVKSDFAKYRAKAEQVRAVLARYDPRFIAAGLDESYLDVTACLEERGVGAAELAEEIRAAVAAETQLTCSCGVAANRMLAKICSDLNKPDGQYVLANERGAVMRFISDLPIRKVPGIGKVSEKVLVGLGVRVCSDLVSKAGLLSHVYSATAFESFLRAGLGIGSSEPVGDEEEARKGISCERTFSAAGLEGARLEERLGEIVATLAKQMQEKGLRARHMTVKMKRVDFVIKSRCASLDAFTCDPAAMLRKAVEILREAKQGALRLIGVRMADFEDQSDAAAAAQGTATIPELIEKRKRRAMGAMAVDGSSQGMTDAELALALHKQEREILTLSARAAPSSTTTTKKKRLRTGPPPVKQKRIEHFFKQ